MQLFVLPPAATWSRVRHCSESGQPPLRFRSRPKGVDSLAPDTLSRVHNANRQCEFTAWVAEQALHCRTCRLVLLFPEDLGGHSSDGPASVWQTKEFMLLESLNEARRGGAFLCQLSEVDQRRPLGVLTNVPGLWPFLQLGWPSFSQSDDNLVYTGPLPRYCPCKKQHEVLKGTLSVDQFYTSRASTFWTAPLVSLF